MTEYLQLIQISCQFPMFTTCKNYTNYVNLLSFWAEDALGLYINHTSLVNPYLTRSKLYSNSNWPNLCSTQAQRACLTSQVKPSQSFENWGSTGQYEEHYFECPWKHTFLCRALTHILLTVHWCWVLPVNRETGRVFVNRHEAVKCYIHLKSKGEKKKTKHRLGKPMQC